MKSIPVWVVGYQARFIMTWDWANISDQLEQVVKPDGAWQEREFTASEKCVFVDHEPSAEEIVLIRAKICNYLQDLFDYHGTITVRKTWRKKAPPYLLDYMLSAEEAATSSILEVREIASKL